jgi:hypothetical protein
VRTRPWVLENLSELTDLAQVQHVIDVGAGAGGWLEFLKQHTPAARWTAVEIWRPYINQFHLASRYDTVVAADARTIEFPPADLMIFGDVLEHMYPDEATACWERALLASRWVVASLPIYIRYEQGELEGNVHETHLHHWDHDSFMEAFSGIVRDSPFIENCCAGAFIARGWRK